MGFRALDISNTGEGGGPIHSPSDILEIYFQGGVNIARVEQLKDGGVVVTYGAAAGYVWQLESKDDLSQASWMPVDEPVTGSDHFVQTLDVNPAAAHRFYRLEALPAVP